MASKGQVASEEEIKALYDPNTFYEHGNNPAYKKLMEISVENMPEGRLLDYRTYVVNKYVKFFWARNLEEFIQNDLKAFTFTRTFAVFLSATFGTFVAFKWARNLLPVGEHGITSLSQTQFYHRFGPFGIPLVLLLPTAASYIWFKTARLTAYKFYDHVIRGERVWLHEMDKNNLEGEYYFKDTPLAADENLSDLARGEMAKKKYPKPEWEA
eukprot:TRINITY_DN2594_c0_g1_i1.p1 TRINITY_DN2594_c0_g1~~TRINITY_DN2594_c0_g1_i1.p1  ORF type:complete len:212 (+),score=74.15 TRINITY_DN2594_c0_g1_i1:69-704(+)